MFSGDDQEENDSGTKTSCEKRKLDQIKSTGKRNKTETAGDKDFWTYTDTIKGEDCLEAGRDMGLLSSSDCSLLKSMAQKFKIITRLHTGPKCIAEIERCHQHPECNEFTTVYSKLTEFPGFHIP